MDFTKISFIANVTIFTQFVGSFSIEENDLFKVPIT